MKANEFTVENRASNIVESKSAKDILDFLDKQSVIAWDMQGTLVSGGASIVIQKFIVAHPKIKHYIITTETKSPNLEKYLNQDLGRYPYNLTANNFTGIIGSDPRKFGLKSIIDFNRGDMEHFNPEIDYLTNFKAQACKELGIKVLVDDDLRREESCRRLGIAWIDPYDLLPSKQFINFKGINWN